MPLKLNEAELLPLGFDGLPSIVVSGSVLAIVQRERVRGRVSVADAVDRADLEGVVAVRQTRVALRAGAGREAAAVELALETCGVRAASVPLKLNDAALCRSGSTDCVSIVVSGGVVSIVQVNEAGVGSTLPTPSIARTWKVWSPSESPAYSFGLVQAAKLPSSSLHSKLATPVPASVPLKLNDAEPLALGFGGLLAIVVSGGEPSTVCATPAEVLSLKLASPT